MVQLFCQISILGLFVMTLFTMIHDNVEGSPAKKPSGYPGIVGTIISMVAATLLQYGAGSFSQILP